MARRAQAGSRPAASESIALIEPHLGTVDRFSPVRTTRAAGEDQLAGGIESFPRFGTNGLVTSSGNDLSDHDVPES